MESYRYITEMLDTKEIKEIVKHQSMRACPKCHKHLHLAFEGTSLGHRVFLICRFCKWEKDITNYENF